jgi:hypothetical protein
MSFIDEGPGRRARRPGGPQDPDALRRALGRLEAGLDDALRALDDAMAGSPVRGADGATTACGRD